MSYATGDYFPVGYIDNQNCETAPLGDDPAFVADLANAVVIDPLFIDALVANPEFVTAILASTGFLNSIGKNPDFVQALITDGTLADSIMGSPLLYADMAVRLFRSEGAIENLVAAGLDDEGYQLLADEISNNPNETMNKILYYLNVKMELISDDGSVITEATRVENAGTVEYTFDAAIANGDPLSRLRIGFS